MNIGATQERKGFQVNTQALTTKTVKSVIKHVFGPFLEPKGPGIKEWHNIPKWTLSAKQKMFN